MFLQTSPRILPDAGAACVVVGGEVAASFPESPGFPPRAASADS